MLAKTGSAMAQGEAQDYPAKAAFLYKFGAYVAWPAAAFPTAASAFNVCVVGRDPFGPALDHAVQGQTIGARPIVVRRVGATAGVAGCHIVFVGGSREEPVRRALKVLAHKPMLTVTDGPDSDGKGMIHFLALPGQVRFTVDRRAARFGGLTVSSKLLNLAAEVDR
jgi:hypothetical protein